MHAARCGRPSQFRRSGVMSSNKDAPPGSGQPRSSLDDEDLEIDFGFEEPPPPRLNLGNKPELRRILSRLQEGTKPAKARPERPPDKPRQERLPDKPRHEGLPDKPRQERLLDKPRQERLLDKPRQERLLDKPQQERPPDKLQQEQPPEMAAPP